MVNSVNIFILYLFQWKMSIIAKSTIRTNTFYIHDLAAYVVFLLV
jgi:hypothetical protein